MTVGEERGKQRRRTSLEMEGERPWMTREGETAERTAQS